MALPKKTSFLAFAVFVAGFLFSGFFHFSPTTHAVGAIVDGDLIRAQGSFDVWIVKIKVAKKFKRLILNPDIFNSYGHLKWENVKDVPSATLAEYKTSNLVIEVNADGSVANPKVYVVASSSNADTGERRWLNVTAEEFTGRGLDWDSLFYVNHTEASPSFYPETTELVSTDDIKTWAEGDPGTVSIQQALNFTWTKDVGSRIASGNVPFVLNLPDGRIRLYYCGQGGIVSAISSDGLNFTQEGGLRISPGSGNEMIVCDPTLVTLSDGRVRMYYKGANSGSGGPGQAIHKIYSATSSDGLTFTKEGLRLDSETSGDRGWASVPDAILLPDGRVRLFYVSGDPALTGGIASAISSDGLTFTRESGMRTSGGVDPAVFRLSDGRYLMAVASIDPNFPPYLANGLYLFVSQDGVTFSDRQTILLENNVFDPMIVQVDQKIFRIYYGRNVGVSNTTESITGRLP